MNSVRSIEFVERLVGQYSFHQYDADRLRTNVVKQGSLTNDQRMIVYLLAAQRNDVTRLMQAFLDNYDMNSAGYDGTTLLHVAARFYQLIEC